MRESHTKQRQLRVDSGNVVEKEGGMWCAGMLADVLKLVLAQGFRFAFFGVLGDLAGALVLTRVLASLLFGVTPTDPATYALVTALLALVAFLACSIPTRRATRVDPMVALRYE
jgi:ABC-type antimicrobial peptide transport system permease subunit